MNALYRGIIQPNAFVSPVNNPNSLTPFIAVGARHSCQGTTVHFTDNSVANQSAVMKTALFVLLRQNLSRLFFRHGFGLFLLR